MSHDKAWEFFFSDLGNRAGFLWRNLMTWCRPLASDAPVSKQDLRLQSEVAEFLNLFSWRKYIARHPPESSRLAVADIGARNFAMAPVLNALFEKHERQAEIHGFEIDPFRRMTNFRTRADYGRYFAQKIPSGQYHPFDFLKWKAPIDVAFLLHPFVTPEPLLSWGLPLSHLKPSEIFDHCRRLLTPQKGVLLFCCPTEEERDICYVLAEEAGFEIVERCDWLPRPGSIQSLPRLGALALPKISR